MDKQCLIERLKRVRLVGTGKIIIKELDYSGNPLLPVAKAYKDILHGCAK